MAGSRKDFIKTILGQIPFSAELYWLVRQRGKPLRSRFTLKNLQDRLPEIVKTVQEFKNENEVGKKVFLFSTLHYWIEHTSLLGAALSALGHQVTVSYLPYADWRNPINQFDLRRQNAYAGKVLGDASKIFKSISFLNQRYPLKPTPAFLQEIAKEVAILDSQYTLQNEDVDFETSTYKLRYERNLLTAKTAFFYLKDNKPDVVIVPNGMIQELGVIFRIARLLKIPTVTYEFGDQRNRIWISQNVEVMRQNTNDMWEAFKDEQIKDKELSKVQELFSSRQHASLWKNFSRKWQDVPSQGSEKVRKQLNLDDRPVILLATNVLGDSLTLDRQVFSESMTEWISRTVQYFSALKEYQLVVRIHPGEVLTHGVSMSDVINSLLPVLPEHIHVIQAEEKINTYDLMGIADLGLVYTTTVGLEMALMGIPVIVSGNTHYRNRGFTHDPDSWVNYYKSIKRILDSPKAYRLKEAGITKAWQYAYRFFFNYPLPFPWHLVKMWEDYDKNNLAKVLEPENFEQYKNTFNWIVGEEIDWAKTNGNKK